MNNSDMPAAPCEVKANDQMKALGMSHDFNARGLTKREAFAMAAMQNILSHYNPYEQDDFDSSDYESAATQAVGLADALLKELDKQE